MDVVADTNVWLRIADDQAAQHLIAKHCVQELLARNTRLYLVPQNIIEFWAVATRSREANGLGWTIERTSHELQILRGQFALLRENERVFDQWVELVEAHQVTGKQVHDARLVAQLMVHDVFHLLTFNDQHFRRFTSLSILRPEEIHRVR